MDTYTNKDVDLSNEATRNQFIKNYQNITSKVDGKEPLSLSDVSKVNNIVLPDNKPTEVTTGVLGQNVESTLAGAKSQPKDDGKKEVETLLSNYLKGASETPEEVTSANEEVIARKTEADKIQKKLTAMEKAYRDEINEIRKNTEGAFGGAVQDRINKATDRYNDNRANVSIEYNTALGAYNSAVETAELKATTYKNRLDSMYKAWEMKKEAVYDLATPEEKAQLDLMTYEKKSQIDAKVDAKSKVLQTMLKNGAPTSAYSLVDEASNRPDATAESIYASAGRWGQEGTTTEAPKVVKVNGVDSIWDGTKFVPAPTGQIIGGTQNVQLARAKSDIDQVSNLVDEGLSGSAVGTSIISRSPSSFWGVVGKIATVVGIPGLAKDAYNKLTGKQQEFISGVEQLRSQLTLDSLINAKSQGATFGALSEGEMNILSSSASKLGTWAIKDKSGNVVGYNTSQSNFQKEMDKINNFAKLDYILKGGNPEDIGAITMTDGTIWVKNSDDTLTQIK